MGEWRVRCLGGREVAERDRADLHLIQRDGGAAHHPVGRRHPVAEVESRRIEAEPGRVLEPEDDVAGAGIDELRVTLDGPEPPILDGDALSYLDLIDKAGVKEQPAPRSAMINGAFLSALTFEETNTAYGRFSPVSVKR